MNVKTRERIDEKRTFPGGSVICRYGKNSLPAFRQRNREGVSSLWKKISQSGKITMLSDARR